MTAPLLTPADTAIYDDDVIADLEHRDVLPCAVSGCANVIRWRLVLKCPCRQTAVFCRWHKLSRMLRLSRLLRSPFVIVSCGVCEHVFPHRTPVGEVVTEVPL